MCRPLTAEEISQRREALKQRLAEKRELDVSAGGELSHGNLDELFDERLSACLTSVDLQCTCCLQLFVCTPSLIC